MDAQDLRQRLNEQPFEQLDVKTTDGDTFRVINPEYYFILPPHDRVIMIVDKDGHYRHVSIEHIVSIEPVRKPKKRVGKR